MRLLLQSIGKCYKLRLLDIAANDLRIFPTEVIFIFVKCYCKLGQKICHKSPLKILDIQKDAVITQQLEQDGFTVKMMNSKDAERIANAVDAAQIVPLGAV